MNIRVAFSRFVMAVGLALFVWGAHGAYTGLKARSWPHTIGFVLESSVKKRFKIEYPHILYSYRVNGNHYTGDRLMSGPEPGPGTKNPKALVAKLKNEKQIDVVHHPEKPERALLVTGIGDTVLLLLLSGVTFFSAGLLLKFPEGNGCLGIFVFLLFFSMVVFLMVPKVRKALVAHHILSTMDEVVVHDSRAIRRKGLFDPEKSKQLAPSTVEIVKPEPTPKKQTTKDINHSVLYVSSEKGIYRIDEKGGHEILIGEIKNSYCLEVYGENLYVSTGARGASIKTYTLNGRLINEISIPAPAVEYLTFKCLPHSRFALLDNKNDAIHFIDSDGFLLKTAGLSQPDKHWQDLDGVVVNNLLYVGEVSESKIVVIDLDTFAVSMFKDLSDRLYAISAVAYSPQSGFFYASDQDRGLYAFSQAGPPKKIGSPMAGFGYYAELEIDYPRAYIMSTKGVIGVMDLNTGSFKKFCDLQVRTRALTIHVSKP